MEKHEKYIKLIKALMLHKYDNISCINYYLTASYGDTSIFHLLLFFSVMKIIFYDYGQGRISSLLGNRVIVMRNGLLIKRY